ncbi:MAG: hypothetical protein SGBAC_005162 [Bacillariaceae sp.]
MAHAPFLLFKNHSYNGQEHCLAVSKQGLSCRFLKIIPGFHDTGVALGDAIEISDIVILAVPASALKGLLGRYFPLKVLVDITNSSICGEDLHGMLGLTATPWVKPLNDNGAVDMFLDKPISKKSMVSLRYKRGL